MSLAASRNRKRGGESESNKLPNGLAMNSLAKREFYFCCFRSFFRDKDAFCCSSVICTDRKFLSASRRIRMVNVSSEETLLSPQSPSSAPAPSDCNLISVHVCVRQRLLKPFFNGGLSEPLLPTRAGAGAHQSNPVTALNLSSASGSRHQSPSHTPLTSSLTPASLSLVLLTDCVSASN